MSAVFCIRRSLVLRTLWLFFVNGGRGIFGTSPCRRSLVPSGLPRPWLRLMTDRESLVPRVLLVFRSLDPPHSYNREVPLIANTIIRFEPWLRAPLEVITIHKSTPKGHFFNPLKDAILTSSQSTADSPSTETASSIGSNRRRASHEVEMSLSMEPAMR